MLTLTDVKDWAGLGWAGRNILIHSFLRLKEWG